MSKATLYLEEPVHKALRLKAVETRQTISNLVNDALKASFLEDIADWRERKNDETIGFEDFIALLKEDGVI